jgi:hypothetical protein
MVEHVGSVEVDRYAQRLGGLLDLGGRLLNHGIARLRHGDPGAGPFSERYGSRTRPAAPLAVGMAALPVDIAVQIQCASPSTLPPELILGRAGTPER